MEDGLLFMMVVTRAESDFKVLLSRHFDRATDVQAEWEIVHNATVEDVLLIEYDEEDMIAEVDGKYIAFTKVADLVIYVVGCGIYDEIILSECLAAIVAAMKQLLPKGLNSLGVLEEYAKINIAIDDIICGGTMDLSEGDRRSSSGK